MVDGQLLAAPGRPFITVVICTRNRPGSLRRALTSLCDLSLPSDLAWELLIIDNGDIHPVDDVAREYADRLPIRLQPEPVAGISTARNRAVAEARGGYLVWTDDDVRVDPRWLAAYVDAFCKWPDASFFGGSASPVFEPSPHRWMERFQDQLGPMLAERGPETDSGISPDDLPYGLNFATKAEAHQHFRFDTAFGRRPGQSVAGEETDLFRRMIAAGHEGRWVPDARVHHLIPPERQTAKYLYDYYFAAGREFVIRRRENRISAMEGSIIFLKAVVLTLAQWVPLSTHHGVALRRSYALNMGKAAQLRRPGIDQG